MAAGFSIRRTITVAGALVAAGSLVLTGCKAGPNDTADQGASSTESQVTVPGETGAPGTEGTEATPDATDATAMPPTSPEPTTPSPTPTPTPAPTAKVKSTPAAGATEVQPDKPLSFAITNGTWKTFKVTDAEGDELVGKMNGEKTTWTSTDRMHPDMRYTVAGTSTVREPNAKPDTPYKTTFHTVVPDKKLVASIAPLNGQTVGTGMPIMIWFNNPVTDKAKVERALTVTPSMKVAGSWHWFTDKEVHWRPAQPWKPGMKVKLKVAIRGLNAGSGTWGMNDRGISFTIGRDVRAHVYADKHLMNVYVDGKLARTIRVTTGKPGFTTRSGVKLIMEKLPKKRMTSASIGINSGSEYYNVMTWWAQRVTNSGEFIHAAPWSESAQGRDNVSHGCVGMTKRNAKWFYQQTLVGSFVTVTGTNRKITRSANAWDDWNMSWTEYKSGSALN